MRQASAAKMAEAFSGTSWPRGSWCRILGRDWARDFWPLCTILAGSVLAHTPAVAQQFGRVDDARLRNASTETDQWLTTGRDIQGTYYSPLTQINDKNVGRLGLAWERKTETYRALEATPVVVDGIMYTSGSWGVAYALNAATGQVLWKFDPVNNGQAGRNACCDVVNRGVIVWKGRVYVSSTDGRLFALDARTGRRLWAVDTIVDHRQPYTVTGVPQLAGDAVLIGNAGSDIGHGGVRGYVSAYDLRTGRFRWRFYAVPARDDPKPTAADRAALRTWDAHTTPRGGTVWAGTSYDPELGLVYIGTGNAAPYQERDRTPDGGEKDDLYTSSIVALNARNGALAWFFQTTPGDNWDQDAISPFIQADLEVDGRLRQVIMQAPKNGFFYVLDRRTGELISGKPFTYVNWARGLDAKGRPLLTKDANYTKEPQLIYPSTAGAHSWMPMAYSSITRLVYIPVIDAPMVFVDLHPAPLSFVDGSFGVGVVFPDKDYNPQDWEQWFGRLPGYEADGRGPRRVIRGVLRAWDPVASRVVWEQETSRDYFLYDGGVLATGGNLVLQGRGDGVLVAYAADTGKVLTRIETGVGIMAAPMSYEVAGVQYVAVMEGYGGGAIGLPFPPNSAGARHVNEGRIVAFRLDGGTVALPPVREEAAVEPPAQHGSSAEIARGNLLYASYCSRCHVFGPGVLPDLRRMPTGVHSLFEEIVLRGRLASLGMGRFDDVLSAADVSAIHTYLVSEGWKLLKEQKASPSSSVP